MKKSLLFSGAALAVFAGWCCGAAEGTVNAAWLNARVFPELKAPVAVKLPRGKKVEVVKLHGAWLEIAAPDTTPVYASAASLDGNRVLRDINLRVKPAAGAPVIGRIGKGGVLKAVSVPDRFGWVQVAPLPDMRLYVYREYVTYDVSKVPVAKAAPAPEKKAEEPSGKVTPAPEKKAEEPSGKVTPAPEKKAEEPSGKVTPAPEKKAEEPSGKVTPSGKAAPAPEKKAEKVSEKKFQLTAARKAKLLYLGADVEKQEKFEKNGRLVAVREPINDCTAFALTDLADSRSLGFVFAEPPVRLNTMVNKAVSVKGVAFRVKNWRNPVVAVREISLIGE